MDALYTRNALKIAPSLTDELKEIKDSLAKAIETLLIHLPQKEDKTAFSTHSPTPSSLSKYPSPGQSPFNMASSPSLSDKGHHTTLITCENPLKLLTSEIVKLKSLDVSLLSKPALNAVLNKTFDQIIEQAKEYNEDDINMLTRNAKQLNRIIQLETVRYVPKSAFNNDVSILILDKIKRCRFLTDLSFVIGTIIDNLDKKNEVTLNALNDFYDYLTACDAIGFRNYKDVCALYKNYYHPELEDYEKIEAQALHS